MHLRLRRKALATATLATVAVVAACGQDDYTAAEDALRAWLAAVEDGDAAACDLETDAYHRELVAEHSELDAAEVTCEERVTQKVLLTRDDGPPSPDSEMDVPVWDPSGEALVEVTDERGGEVKKYWLVLRDGSWLVAGDEP